MNKLNSYRAVIVSNDRTRRRTPWPCTKICTHVRARECNTCTHNMLRQSLQWFNDARVSYVTILESVEAICWSVEIPRLLRSRPQQGLWTLWSTPIITAYEINIDRLIGKDCVLRQKCFYSSSDVRSTHWTVSELWSTILTRDKMPTWQEHGIDLHVHANFTRPGFHQSAMFIQQLFCFVCITSFRTIVTRTNQ
jgi:hypothetical protein